MVEQRLVSSVFHQARTILVRMEPLPFIDDLALPIAAPAAEVWSALLRTLGKVNAPGWLMRAWGLHDTGRRGDWSREVSVGDSIPGFAVADCAAGRHLVLRGGHRFSRYQLRFELEPAGEGVVVHAITHAAFPGLLGRIYRACVIGTGGHRIVGRRLLATVARRALARSADAPTASAGAP